MSVNALKPNFTNKEGYLSWRNTWKLVYAELSKRIRRRKHEVKALQRRLCECQGSGTMLKETINRDNRIDHHWENCACDGQGLSITEISRAQRELFLMRKDATKMMTLLDEAKQRRDRIIQMQKDVSNQPFPVEVEANRVDVFYNRGHNEFSFLPRWVIQTKGRSFYVDHIDADVPWSTRELDTGSTKGMLRFRKCRVNICADRIATLRAA